MNCNSGISLLIVSLALGGCATKGQTGALVGAGVGVGAGALIGGGTGAVVGGAVGAVAGGLIGASLDENDQENLHKRSRSTYNKVDRGEQLDVDDIIALSQAGISDKKIIELIQKTNSHYYLTSYQVDRMRRAGVSERVINYMAQT